MYLVNLSRAAERDLEEVYHYLVDKESTLRAKRIVGELLTAIVSLSEMPERGHTPVEQRKTATPLIREIVINGFRIIYEIMDTSVLVIAVAHHRRNMRSLLERRLDS